jgi:hypothetical protein
MPLRSKKREGQGEEGEADQGKFWRGGGGGREGEMGRWDP